MDITPYVENLRRDLLAAAQAGGEEAQSYAERLGHALDAAVRLALMEAISQAAAEITAELPAGGVDVRLDGRDLAFAVHAPAPAAQTSPAVPDPEDDGTARITLRLPESLKTHAEDAASRAGQSLNAWLVAAVRRAARPGAEPDVDLASRPLVPSGPFTSHPGPRRVSGWL